MPYNRARFARLHPVESLKHVVETNGTVSAALPSINDVIITKDSPLSTNVNEVKKMSTVSAIYLRVEVAGIIQAGGVDNIYMAVFKNPGGNLIIPALDGIGASDNRKYVIHQEMIMLTPQGSVDNNSFPRTLFNGVIRIPRGYKRNGINDKLTVVLQHRTGEVTQTTQFCIECIYKEFQ